MAPPQEDENTLKILLATDIHLGYMEKDPIRGNDSLVAFEEILEIAKKKEVDFILLGGDLYHDNKPSRRTLHGSMALLRRYCMGDKPIQYEFLSDQSVNFSHCQFPLLNYEDQNYNVSMPVFSIHGNHDDPTGTGNLCSLDLLHSAGLVNYFGKTSSLEKIQLSPLLLEKGTTKLALYGLGSVRDERLHRMFVHKNIAMLRPKENKDDWFNIFVIHQNRSKHSATNYIPEQFLDDFLDLVFWGHEHECRIDPEWNGNQNFYVTQPGSSIATSLSEGESATKHVGLLMIRGKDFKMTKIPLETVRQFYIEDIVLSETTLSPDDHDVSKKVEAYCQQKVENLLQKAEAEHTGNAKQPDKPLIRIRVDYAGGFEPFSVYRFGQKFVDRVANPKDVVLFQRKRVNTAKKEEGGEGDAELLANIKPQSLDSARVEDMVREYFNKVDGANQLQVLTEKGMGDAIKEYVDKEEREAISELVKYQIGKTQKYLKDRNAPEEIIDVEICRFKEERKQKKQEDEEIQEALKIAISKRESQNSTGYQDDENNDSIMDSDESESSSVSSTSRGRGRGRGSRARGTSNQSTRGRGSRGGRGKKAAVVVENNNTIMNSFSRASSQRAGAKAVKYKDSGSEPDDDTFNIPSSSRKRKNTSPATSAARTKTKKPVTSDSDSDEELFSSSKRRR
ncbi:double-strand break repair protein MRE11 [Patella vulgata]|uniref:double-strand break repair protein MRE11 n=1 Tax=Patella vulgata TaxID=6465 RepID=UPI0021805083|nr:double-strand break repair protein MRE11 [Patella vulgata]